MGVAHDENDRTRRRGLFLGTRGTRDWGGDSPFRSLIWAFSVWGAAGAAEGQKESRVSDACDFHFHSRDLLCSGTRGFGRRRGGGAEANEAPRQRAELASPASR